MILACSDELLCKTITSICGNEMTISDCGPENYQSSLEEIKGFIQKSLRKSNIPQRMKSFSGSRYCISERGRLFWLNHLYHENLIILTECLLACL